MTKEEILDKLNNPPFKKSRYLWLLGSKRISVSTIMGFFFVNFITKVTSEPSYYRAPNNLDNSLLRLNIL